MPSVEELQIDGGILVFTVSHICGENGKGMLSGLSPLFYVDQGTHSEAVTQAMGGWVVEVHISDDLSGMIDADIFVAFMEQFADFGLS